jgi:hypothetical protein
MRLSAGNTPALPNAELVRIRFFLHLLVTPVKNLFVRVRMNLLQDVLRECGPADSGKNIVSSPRG